MSDHWAVTVGVKIWLIRTIYCIWILFRSAYLISLSLPLPCVIICGSARAFGWITSINIWQSTIITKHHYSTINNNLTICNNSCNFDCSLFCDLILHSIDGNYQVITLFFLRWWWFTTTLRELGEFSLPPIFCMTYTTMNKYYPGEPVNILIQWLIHIMQRNNRLITTKKW